MEYEYYIIVWLNSVAEMIMNKVELSLGRKAIKESACFLALIGTNSRVRLRA
jgi:hypothetical protein